MLSHAEILKKLDSSDTYAEMIIAQNAAIRLMLNKPIQIKRESELDKLKEGFKKSMFTKRKNNKS